mmetsp:Transcript_994/g.2126  ORF Transcript_994/g.2126 Transcript_994/m.2126 type:complete len:337 (-) Transcript_994:335-1345(-)
MAFAVAPMSRDMSKGFGGSARSCTTSCSLEIPSSRARFRRRAENVPGTFFVDSSCIDCDTCRWMAPQVFGRKDGQSYVLEQPISEEVRTAAIRSMISCPTASIHMEPSPGRQEDISTVSNSFPFPVSEELEGVYCNGYASEETFAATSYLWTDSAQGLSVMVDLPRFSERLAKQIEAKSGGKVDFIFLTHRDDAYGHEKWASRLGAKRIMHKAEVRHSHGTDQVEMQLHGNGPWNLGDSLVIHGVPGHTRGSLALLDEKKKVLFTGDHLAWSERKQELNGFRNFTWYSWDVQIKSMEETRKLDFLWVLPGHGRKFKFSSASEKDMILKETIERMRS